MADSTDTKVKDIGSRPVGYTITDEQGPVDLRFDTEKDAQTVLKAMQGLVPPLMTNGRVVPVRGVIKERKGGAGRKSNAERERLAREAAQTQASDGNAKTEATSAKAPASAGARS